MWQNLMMCPSVGTCVDYGFSPWLMQGNKLVFTNVTECINHPQSMKAKSNPVNTSSFAHPLIHALNEHYELDVMVTYERGIEFTIAHRHSLTVQG